MFLGYHDFTPNLLLLVCCQLHQMSLGRFFQRWWSVSILLNQDKDLVVVDPKVRPVLKGRTIVGTSLVVMEKY